MTDLALITEPPVTVLARPAVDWGAVALVRSRYMHPGGQPHADMPAVWEAHPSWPDAESVVELAARRCYNSDGRGRPHDEHLRHILEVGHGSVLEHAHWTFEITGVSRSLSHEWVRHRHAAISQESQRYVDCSEVAFVVPPAMLEAVRRCQSGGPVVGDLEEYNDGLDWVTSCSEDLARYRRLSDRLTLKAPADLPPTERRKWARQAARSVLPNSTATKMVWSANARGLRCVIGQRASRWADDEIRRLAMLLLGIMKAEAPALFCDIELREYAPGMTEAVPLYHKV